MNRYLKLASEFLDHAKYNLDGEMFRTVLDRAYYSIHYAAQAVLVHHGMKPPKSHHGVISVFGTEVVGKGIMDAPFGRSLREAAKLRDKGTYSLEADFDREVAEAAVRDAERFLEEARRVTGHVG